MDGEGEGRGVATNLRYIFEGTCPTLWLLLVHLYHLFSRMGNALQILVYSLAIKHHPLPNLPPCTRIQGLVVMNAPFVALKLVIF